MSEAADRSDNEAYVGSSDAGRRLGLSAQRVRQLAEEGRLPAVKTVLGRLFRVGDVEALAKARGAGGAVRPGGAPAGARDAPR